MGLVKSHQLILFSVHLVHVRSFIFVLLFLELGIIFIYLHALQTVLTLTIFSI